MMSDLNDNVEKRMQVLTLLDAYQQVHEIGENHNRSSLWNIYKTRHLKQRNALAVQPLLQADDIREELRARSVVVREQEQQQQQQEDEYNIGKNKCPFFVLVDIAEEAKSQKENNAPASTNNNKDESTTTLGLRNRKGKEEMVPNLQEEWTVIEEKQHDDEETRLRNANPIDFFTGMPPKELRVAQEEAKKALSFYIEAANMVAAIQHTLAKTTTTGE